jgi:hypothetical protein
VAGAAVTAVPGAARWRHVNLSGSCGPFRCPHSPRPADRNGVDRGAPLRTRVWRTFKVQTRASAPCLRTAVFHPGGGFDCFWIDARDTGPPAAHAGCDGQQRGLGGNRTLVWPGSQLPDINRSARGLARRLRAGHWTYLETATGEKLDVLSGLERAKSIRRGPTKIPPGGTPCHGRRFGGNFAPPAI